ELILYDRSALSEAARKDVYGSLWDHVLGPLQLLMSQVSFHAAVIVIVLAAAVRAGPDRRSLLLIPMPPRSAFDTSLLISTAAGPVAVGILFYAFADVWGRPESFGSMFMMLGPAVVAGAGMPMAIARPRLILVLLVLTAFGPPAATVARYVIRPYAFHRID